MGEDLYIDEVARARTHTHTHTHTHARTHARTHIQARTHARTHTHAHTHAPHPVFSPGRAVVLLQQLEQPPVALLECIVRNGLISA